MMILSTNILPVCFTSLFFPIVKKKQRERIRFFFFVWRILNKNEHHLLTNQIVRHFRWIDEK